MNIQSITLVTTDVHQRLLSTEQYGLGETKADHTSLHPWDTWAQKECIKTQEDIVKYTAY